MYVILPSGASADTYPDNNISTYRIKLSEPLRLDQSKRFEVGLVECQFSTGVRNVGRGCIVELQRGDEVCVKKTMQQGFYTNITDLRDSIYSILGNAYKKYVTLDYSPLSRLVTIKVEHGYKLTLPSNVATILGFDKCVFGCTHQDTRSDEVMATVGNSGDVEARNASMARAYYEERRQENERRRLNIEGNRKREETMRRLFLDDTDTPPSCDDNVTVGSQIYDMWRNLRTIYFYSDIVDYSNVGDVAAPILRSVTFTPDAECNMETKVFQQVHYLPLVAHNISTVKVHITNGLGQPVAFSTGYSQLTIHIRQAKEQPIN